MQKPIAIQEKKRMLSPETSISIDVVDEERPNIETLVSECISDYYMQTEIPQLLLDKLKQKLLSETSQFFYMVIHKMQQQQITTSEKHKIDDDDDFNTPRNLYIRAAFKSKCVNEVFMFMGYQYVVINYDPCAPAKDWLVKEPLLLMEGFRGLRGFHRSSRFHLDVVTAAFSCHDANQAFIFQHNMCAKIEYDIDTKKGRAIVGGRTSDMFPPLKGTYFQHHIDAAFESTLVGEVYIFSFKQCALINYIDGTLIALGAIIDTFPCLENTMFERNIGAAFASHTPNEAYLFKDNKYVRLHFTPGKPHKSYIIEGPMEIIPTNWPSLQCILPCDDSGFSPALYAQENGIESSESDDDDFDDTSKPEVKDVGDDP